MQRVRRRMHCHSPSLLLLPLSEVLLLVLPELRALFGTYLEPTMRAPVRHALLGFGAFSLILVMSVRVGLDRMQLAEITHCRLAMMAFSGLITQAALGHTAFPYF